MLVDPVVSAVAGDSHKNSEVRRGLQPLADFGEATNATGLGITHLSKNTTGTIRSPELRAALPLVLCPAWSWSQRNR
jgi:hypothetical protein